MIKRWFFDQMKMGEKSEIFNKIFKIGPFGLLYEPENLKADQEQAKNLWHFGVESLIAFYMAVWTF